MKTVQRVSRLPTAAGSPHHHLNAAQTCLHTHTAKFVAMQETVGCMRLLRRM